MKKSILLSAIMILIATAPLFAQNNSDQVRLFQSYFFDAPIAKNIYVEPGLDYATSSYYSEIATVDQSALLIGAKGGYPINEKIEVGASLGFLNLSSDPGDSESGLTDIGVYGRYNITNNNLLNFAAGGLVTLPIGEEKVGQSNLNFGGFGAVRYTLEGGIVLAGNLGLIFYETKTVENEYTGGTPSGTTKKSKHESYLNLGFAGIYPINSQLNIVGELTMKTEVDYMMLSGGVDYSMGGGRIRGALGIGLDVGAPDFQIQAGYQLSF